MFTTSLMLSTVAGFLASASIKDQPEWTASYNQALTVSAKQQKPIAVFLASDASKLPGAGLTTDAAKLLKEKFVAVKVDSTTEEGKSLAGSFGIAEGLVISDKSGKLIALRHAGAVGEQALTGYLVKHNGDTAVTATEYVSADPQVMAPTTAPAVATPYSYAPYSPAPYSPYGVQPSCPSCNQGRTYMTLPSFGGGCRSGNCGR